MRTRGEIDDQIDEIDSTLTAIDDSIAEVEAMPAGPAAALADGAVVLQAQTMANETSGAPSLLPMGSLFEAAQLVLFDLVSIMLREKTGQAAGEMSARHTNLE